jgi:hypothetical protein
MQPIVRAVVFDTKAPGHQVHQAITQRNTETQRAQRTTNERARHFESIPLRPLSSLWGKKSFDIVPIIQLPIAITHWYNPRPRRKEAL